MCNMQRFASSSTLKITGFYIKYVKLSDGMRKEVDNLFIRLADKLK